VQIVSQYLIIGSEIIESMNLTKLASQGTTSKPRLKTVAIKTQLNKNSYLSKMREQISKSSSRIHDDSNFLELMKFKEIFGKDAPTNMLHKIKFNPFGKGVFINDNHSNTNSDIFKTQIKITTRKPSFVMSTSQLHFFTKPKQSDNRQQSVLWSKSANVTVYEKPNQMGKNRIKTYKVKSDPNWYIKNGIIPNNFNELANKDLEIQSAIISDEVKISLDNMNYYRTHYLHNSKVNINNYRHIICSRRLV
jgi:hypothetical protein